MLGLFAVFAAYLAALLGPLWFVGDTVQWICDDRRAKGISTCAR